MICATARSFGPRWRTKEYRHCPGVFTRRQNPGFRLPDSSESDIRLWDVATGKEIGRLEGHESWVGSLVFWPDGKKLASSSADQTIRIWDVASRKCLDVLRGHRQEVWRLALLPDDKTLVSGAKDGTVCFWDTSVTHPASVSHHISRRTSLTGALRRTAARS